MNIISAENISKSYGMKFLFSDLSFGIEAGERIGLIGINGTGKTTLIKILAGLELPDNGHVITGNNIRISYLPQNPNLKEGCTVLEAAMQGNLPVAKLTLEYEMVLTKAEIDPSDVALQQRLVWLNQRIDEDNGWKLESEAKTILTKLGVTDFKRKINYLSGGQRKRVAIAAALLDPADLLILDEPTNHIDNESIVWLEQHLSQRTGALLMITHDRYFLDRVTDRIFELDNGKLYSYQGNYSIFLEKKAQREDQEASTAEKRGNLYQRELAWIRKGAKARSTKQKARIERFEAIKEQMGKETRSSSIEIMAGASRLGKKVIELAHLEKSLAGQKLINDFNYVFSRKDRVGIIGPNGVGKSTLLNIIVGNVQPDHGQVELGPTVRIGYFTQDSQEMNDNLRVIDYIKEQAEFISVGDGLTISASQLLERFLFSPDAQWSPIAKLSGGERRRLFLLRVLMSAPNVLLLDEPTNDLDVRTLSILEDYLEDFPGVVITVSHDRYFLDRVVDKIISFQADGSIHCTVGNYSYYLDEEKRLNHLQTVVEPIKKHTNSMSSNTNAKVRPNKLSYMEQREYDGIEEVIASVEGDLEYIKLKIEEAGSDFQALQEYTATQGQLEQRLDELLERWTYLSELVAEYEKTKL